jgi:O-methyltransferase
MKRLVQRALRSMGYELRRVGSGGVADVNLRAVSEQERRTVDRVLPFTNTSVERVLALINATAYITSNSIPGDITECGVWRGGSMMAVALTLLAHGDQSRRLFLYDTFEGMSEPTDHDTTPWGDSAAALLERYPRGTGPWCYAGIDEVRANLVSTGYPAEKIIMVAGRVEDTIPRHLPGELSLLRLDTDWYESTQHELTHLYPLLVRNGILIIDDYGHWQGARKAVDEYFMAQPGVNFLHRIDYTGRLLVKSGA